MFTQINMYPKYDSEFINFSKKTEEKRTKRNFTIHCKSKRFVLAPKMGPFRWVKYSTNFGANSARLEWSCFGPSK